MKRFLCGVTFVMALATVLPAMAVRGRSAEGEFEEAALMVTAQKQSEDVMAVPMSMAVFTDDHLNDAGMVDTREMIQFSPNVYMRDSGYEHVIVIRWVSSYGGGLTSPAGYYVDDIAHPLKVMHNTDLLDIEWVAVLRGPQGTLYGKNSESGLVHIVTRAPDNGVRGRVRLGFGNENSWDAGAAISGPILRVKLFAGIQVLGLGTDGHIENRLTGSGYSAKKNHISGRARLR